MSLWTKFFTFLSWIQLQLTQLVSVIKGEQNIALLRLDTELSRDEIAYVTNILIAFLLFFQVSHFCEGTSLDLWGSDIPELVY